MSSVPSKPSTKAPGILYVLHFRTPLHHAKHYIGSSEQLAERLAAHEAGQGARLTQVMMQIQKELGREDEAWFLGGLYQLQPFATLTIREVEALVKRRRNGPRLCEICQQGQMIKAPRGTIRIPSSEGERQ